MLSRKYPHMCAYVVCAWSALKCLLWTNDYTGIIGPERMGFWNVLYILPKCPSARLSQLIFTAVNDSALSSHPSQYCDTADPFLFAHPWWVLMRMCSCLIAYGIVGERSSLPYFFDWLYFHCEFSCRNFAYFPIWFLVFSYRSIETPHIFVCESLVKCISCKYYLVEFPFHFMTME